MKKILMLGGSQQQVPILEKAKEMGHYVLLCDYLPDNPGQQVVDEFFEVSTTEKDAVLQVAVENNIDGVLAYASDPAAPTAAYVAERLNLPGNPVEAVNILCNKGRFRKLQDQLALHHPRYRVCQALEEVEDFASEAQGKIVIKPTDSSGSKGVQVLSNESGLSEAYEAAKSYSKSETVIVEEFVHAVSRQMHGDGLVVNGDLKICLMGRHHYAPGTNAPIATFWNTGEDRAVLDSVRKVVQSIINAVGFLNGQINIEARITASGEPFIVEIGPRAGGNFTPVVLSHLSSFDFLEANVNLALGKQIEVGNVSLATSGGYYVVHTHTGGRLKSHPDMRCDKSYIEYFEYIKTGGHVPLFKNASDAVGVYLFKDIGDIAKLNVAAPLLN